VVIDYRFHVIRVIPADIEDHIKIVIKQSIYISRVVSISINKFNAVWERNWRASETSIEKGYRVAFSDQGEQEVVPNKTRSSEQGNRFHGYSPFVKITI